MVSKKLVGALAVSALLTPAAALPALADSSVAVTVTGLGGTRQFAVEDLTGAPLTALDLGTGGAKPFRTHVTDSAFLPSGSGDFSVSATLSNLYLKTGASSYNYAVKVPSSEVAIGFGSNALAGQAISLVTLPKLSVSGTLSSCASLPAQIKTALGLSALGAVLDPTNTALVTLCSTLGVAGGPVAATVDGALQTLTPVLTSVADLPQQLAGATGGAFTNPSFGAGTVGAGDTAGAAGAPAATSVSLMTGTRGLSSGLVTALTNALNSALAGLPLVSGTGAAAQSTTEAVIAGLTSSSNTLLANSLANVLSTLSAADQAGVLNAVLTTVDAIAPGLADVKAVNGQYFSFPVLTATPTTPVAGTYGGTMTVTFVQS